MAYSIHRMQTAPGKQINKMKKLLFVLVGQSRDWSTAFAVESRAAAGVVNALNAGDCESWEAITVPMSAEEIEPTRQSWRDDGIIA